jgi:hypothetical protein
MGRFARDDGARPGSLDGAADELQASVERYVRELLSAAEARASEISDRAARRAFELGAGAATADPTARMLEAIDSVESRIAESFALLRVEAETLLGALEGAHAAARDGDHSADETWIEELDDSMAELLFLDDLPE